MEESRRVSSSCAGVRRLFFTFQNLNNGRFLLVPCSRVSNGISETPRLVIDRWLAARGLRKLQTAGEHNSFLCSERSVTFAVSLLSYALTFSPFPWQIASACFALGLVFVVVRRHRVVSDRLLLMLLTGLVTVPHPSDVHVTFYCDVALAQSVS